MADSKITALTSISTSTDPAVDPLVIVDVSDTSMAATGTTKKVTLNNLLSSSPTATGAFSVTGLVTAGSATITGALTAGGNVGFGTTNLTTVSGYTTLKINNATNGAILDLAQGDAYKGRVIGNINGLILESSGILPIQLQVGGLNSLKIDPSGVFTFYDGAGGSGTRMTLNSTGLGIANGNVILSTSGKGIDFSATANSSGTMTSELLNDYEEGTFTPTVSSVGGTGIVYVADATDSGRYTKIGRVVTFQVRLAGTYTGTFSYIRVALPFAATNSNPDGSVIGYNNSTTATIGGRSDSGGAWFIVPNPQLSGATAMYAGFITS